MVRAAHQPGVCNIGPAEIRVRQLSALAGVVLTVALYIILRTMKVSQVLYALEFFPVVLFTTGWNQARSRFCIYFGIKGIFNFGDLINSSSAGTIDDAAFRAADRAMALKLIGRSIILALSITVILILIS